MKKFLVSLLALSMSISTLTTPVLAADSTTSASTGNQYSEPGEMEAEVINHLNDGVVLDNVFVYNHVNGHQVETDRLAYVLFEYEMMDYVKYQVAYLACTCRSPEVNYYSVAYVELDKNDGSVRTFSFNEDGENGHYTPGVFGDSYVSPGDVPNRELVEQYLDDNIRGKSQESINAIEPMHGEVDAYTGATVTPNNLARMMQGLFEYHNAKYDPNYVAPTPVVTEETATTPVVTTENPVVVTGTAADVLDITVTEDNLDESLQALFDYVVYTTGNGVSAEPITEEVTMANFDKYALRPNARYVDLRNFEDTMKAGYIEGFETVPFFDYLEGRALVRNDGWNYTSKDLVNPSLLKNIFGDNLDREIFLMCAGGTRAGYVKQALEELGYTNVYNIGGFGDYNGTYKILGDGTYALPVKVTSLKDVTVNMSNIDNYLERPNARYVDLRNFEDIFKAGYIEGFETVPFFDYLEGRALVRNDGWNYTSKDLVNPALLKNIFGDDLNAEIFLMCAGGTRAGYVREALLDLGYKNVYNIGGFGDYNGTNKVLGDGEFTLTAK